MLPRENLKASEKKKDEFIEEVRAVEVLEDHISLGEGTSNVNEKRLLRKIDCIILPWLVFLYVLSFLDRASIGNAKLYGMETDLSLTDTQYLICLSIFFIPYSLLEVPANICLKHLRPTVWLSSIMVLWGIMMVIQGLVHDFGGLLAVRWMLGVFEAGQYPGTAYYLCCWYKRTEFGLRLATYHSAVAISGAFGGLLAAAISNMSGIGGKPAWAWIFILEGLVTVIAGLLSFYILQDYPETARFLSEQERKLATRRLREDGQSSNTSEKFHWSEVKKSFTDWKTWVGILCHISADGPIYSFSLFLPSIISELGFSNKSANFANLLTVPVYFLAGFVTCVIGYAADRTKRRGIFAIALSGIAMVAYIILIVSRIPALSYFAVYLAACGIYGNVPNVVTWLSNNVEGALKKSISMALLVSAINLTGILSSNIYRARDTPFYTLGHSVTLAYIVIGHVSAIIYRILLQAENRRRDRGERNEVIKGRTGGDVRNGCFDTVEEAKKVKGDLWSGFRYIT